MRHHFPILFPPRLLEIQWIVERAYRERAMTSLKQFRDVERERRVSALVFANLDAVEPDRRVIVYRAKAQYQALSPGDRRGVELALIPDG